MAPLHVFAAAYVVGILVSAWAPIPVPASVGACWLAGALAWRSARRDGSGARPLAALLIAALGAGAASYAACVQPGRWDPAQLPKGTRVAILGRLVRDIPPDAARATTVVRAEAARVGAATVPLRGNAVVRAQSPPEATSGDRVVAVGRSESLRASRKPGEFDAVRYYARRFGAFSAVAEASVLPAPALWDWSPAQLRAAIARRTRALSRDPDHPLRCEVMLSMVFGASGSNLPEPTLESFRRAGTIHVLVVSGAQISILAVLVGWLAGLGRLTGWCEAAVTLALVLLYAALLPPEGSIVRAVALLGVLYAGRAWQRDTEVLSALVTAAFVILCWWPPMLFSLSFQLSVAAVLGVVVATRILAPEPLPSVRLHPVRWSVAFVRAILVASLGASLGTLPLIAGVFGTVSLIAPLANLLVVPPAMVLTVLMFVSVAALPIPPLARALHAPASWLSEAVLAGSQAAGSLPWAALEGRPWPWWACVACYAALGGVAVRGLRWRMRRGV